MSETPKPYLHLVHADIDEEAAEETEETADEAATSELGRQAFAAAAPGADPVASTVAAAAADRPPLNHPLQQAIMHAAVAWVELCVERSCYAVDIQPVARRVYEVNVHYADPETGQEAVGQGAEGIILRVRLEVEPGLALRSTVEPVRPS